MIFIVSQEIYIQAHATTCITCTCTYSETCRCGEGSCPCLFQVHFGAVLGAI